MTRALGAFVLLALTLVPAGTDRPAAQPRQKVVFALNWFPVSEHAAYWVALDKGYYRQRGLDVELQNSKGSGDSIAKVDTGRAHVGLADSAVVIASISRASRVKVVGMVFDKTPMNIWSRADAPITRPRDLEGKTIGAPPGDAQRRVFLAFAKLHGVDPDKVTWINIEPGANIAALAEKRVDAVAGYMNGLPFYEKVMGKGKAIMMPWVDHGFDMYSMSIIASAEMMAEQPTMLRAFLEASYFGWRDVMDDPRAALEIFKKRVPEIDLSIIEPHIKLGLDLMKTERYVRHGIGWIDGRKMCASVDLINTYMDPPKKVDCKDVYTTEFLPKIEVPRSMR
jgi:NitT/TauT family transport system substrate-binding protein